ncbi:MAG: WxL domain-containing protein [Streptococcaceae bacterium]|jgi:hypothetical protein|nr:WxL domain-containing protein [Streptococcaceae bacterium]
MNNKSLKNKLTQMIMVSTMVLGSSMPMFSSSVEAASVGATIDNPGNVSANSNNTGNTPDYGMATDNGGTPTGWTGVATSIGLGAGGSYTSGNMPDVNGASSVKMKAVAPVFDSNGMAVLSSTDNPINTPLTSYTNNPANRGAGRSAMVMGATIDWKSNFTMTYNLKGGGAYGNNGGGVGLMFTPLKPSDLVSYINGNAVNSPLSSSPLQLVAGNVGNSGIANIPNSFGMFTTGDKSQGLQLAFSKQTAAGSTSNSSYNAPSGAPTMWTDPTTPTNSFTFAAGSGFTMDAITDGNAMSPEWKNADYKIDYNASSMLLTVTPMQPGTTTPIQVDQSKIATTNNGGGSYYTAHGTGKIDEKLTFTVPSKLKGVPYSFAISKTMNTLTGLGVGTGQYAPGTGTAGITFPSFPNQPVTTSVQLVNYSIPVATSKVTVTYKDTAGATIKTTTLGANVGNTIGINGLAPNAATDTWTFDPADIPGYKLQSAPTDITETTVAADGSAKLTLTYLAQDPNLFKESNVKIAFQAGPSIVDPLDPENPDISKPLDPTNPDGSVRPPSTGGYLSIDFASGLFFGANNLNKTKIYAHPQLINGAAPVADYAQVTDQRAGADKTGWNLSVQTQGQFRRAGVDPSTEATAPVGDFLTGATINVVKAGTKGLTGQTDPITSKASFTINNSAQSIMSAASGQGVGTWTMHFGTKSDYDTSAVGENDVASKSPITLDIPASTPKKSDKYSTSLLWTLADVPAN